GRLPAESPAEAMASCAMTDTMFGPVTPYSFAKQTLVSLLYARSAAERGNEMKKFKKEHSDNRVSVFTAMLRFTKTATNDFFCAKRALRPFTTEGTEENIRDAAE